VNQVFTQLAIGAAYTPLSIGPDGRIYTQNDGRLFVVGNWRRSTRSSPTCGARSWPGAGSGVPAQGQDLPLRAPEPADGARERDDL